MSKGPSSESKPITDRLDALIRLIALTLPKEINQAKKIEVLSSVGLAPAEIASILGTTANTVSVTLYDIKKKKSTSAQKVEPKSDTSQEMLAPVQSPNENVQKTGES